MQPAYTPQFNSTEFLWAVIKPPLKRQLAMRSLSVDLNRADMCHVLLRVLLSVNLQTIVNLARASVPSIRATYDAL
jgi:hypothetical protein